jgi:hypothetical protein
MPEASEHQWITVAGWGYRTNSRGWVIYQDPQTGLWHTRPDAIFIIQARVSNSETKTAGIGQPPAGKRIQQQPAQENG